MAQKNLNPNQNLNLNRNLIEQTIKTHIHELTSVFVFPTQTAADLWADRATNPTVTNVSAVAMERFIVLSVGLLYMAFTVLSYFPSVPSLLRVFIMKGCCIF